MTSAVTRPLRALACASLLVLILAAPSAHGAAAPTAAATECVWNARADFRFAPDEANPSPDGCGFAGVWSYRSGGTLHDPSTYVFMTAYKTNLADSPLIESWCGGAPGGCSLPIVSVNEGSTSWSSGTVTWPPVSMLVHPVTGGAAVVAWTCPIAGVAAIEGGVQSDDPNGGNGIAWFIDRESATLASGAYPRGGGQSFAQGAGGESLSSVLVEPGQTIYFIVDMNGDYGYDSTDLNLTIRLQPVATNLDAEPAIADVEPGGSRVAFPNLTAHLTTASDGAPLVGKVIAFSTPEGAPICAATTDATGTATCSGSVTLITQLRTGYQARFAGDQPYLASTAHGPLVAVGGYGLT